MGTSASVSGAGLGSPLIPDWVTGADDSGREEGATEPDKQTSQDAASAMVADVKPGRLGGARRDLGKFAIDGDRESMRRGVARYVRQGRGGAALATARSAGSARRAGALAGIVGGAPAYNAIRDRIRDAIQSSASSSEILAAIAAAASPNDGTLDSETGQRAAFGALQYVLQQFPDADPLDLQPPHKDALLERFLALDSFEFFYTEVGKHIQTKANLVLSVAASRISEIKDYFCETFTEVNRSRGASGRPLLRDATDDGISAVCKEVIADAYRVFEAYLDEN